MLFSIRKEHVWKCIPLLTSTLQSMAEKRGSQLLSIKGRVFFAQNDKKNIKFNAINICFYTFLISGKNSNYTSRVRSCSQCVSVPADNDLSVTSHIQV